MTLQVDDEQVRHLAFQFGTSAQTLHDGGRQEAGLEALPILAAGRIGGAYGFTTAYNEAAEDALDAASALARVLLSDARSLHQAAAIYRRYDDDAAADIVVASARTLDVFTTHVHSGRGDPNDAERAAQIGRAWDVVGANVGPTIFTGDLNDAIYKGDGTDPAAGEKTTLSAEEIRRYEELGFTNAAPDGPTSGDGTGRLIDYVFTGPGVATGEAEVVDGGPSDHHGIGVDVAVPHRWW